MECGRVWRSVVEYGKRGRKKLPVSNRDVLDATDLARQIARELLVAQLDPPNYQSDAGRCGCVLAREALPPAALRAGRVAGVAVVHPTGEHRVDAGTTRSLVERGQPEVYRAARGEQFGTRRRHAVRNTAG